MELLTNFIELFVISAPWLLLGLFIAGLINVYLPKDFLNKHLGKEGFVTTVKAAFIGAPMPLCSCGVIPAALGLRRAGASKGATTAFLVATPETGVDSISVSYVLLGPFMAVIRPIAAISSAIVAGVLVGRETSPAKVSSSSAATSSCCSTKKPEPVKSSCCSSATSTASVTSEEPVKTSCCASKAQANTTEEVAAKPEPEKKSCCAKSDLPAKKGNSHWHKFTQSIAYSSTQLLSDTAKWLMIGLFFAALVQTYVPANFFVEWGSGILAMVVVVLVSIPMYICATASTPIAAGLLLSGVSPGAVLVFMLAGPATNIATLGIVGKELGKRAIAAYLVGVIGVAILFGLLTDYLVEHYNVQVAPMLGEHHEVLPEWFMYLTALILAGLLLRLILVHFLQPKTACA